MDLMKRFLAWLADRYTVRECSLYPRYKFCLPVFQVLQNLTFLSGGQDGRHLESIRRMFAISTVYSGICFLPKLEEFLDKEWYFEQVFYRMNDPVNIELGLFVSWSPPGL